MWITGVEHTAVLLTVCLSNRFLTTRHDAKEIQRLEQAVEKADKDRRKQVRPYPYKTYTQQCSTKPGIIHRLTKPNQILLLRPNPSIQEDDRNRLRAGTLALSFSSGDAAGLLALNRTTVAAAQRAQKVQGRRFSSGTADKLRYSEEERRTKKCV